MGSLGSLLNDGTNYSTNVLEAIGETIVVADNHYNIVWMNPNAVDLFSKIVPHFDLNTIEDFIGLNMAHFHRNPAYQRECMDNFSGFHRARITIKDIYVSDIVINPIKADDITVGYVVMFMDVTTKVKEEKRKEKIIHELSAPILQIWDNTLALPLKGIIDESRYQIISNHLLKECMKKEIDYVIIDLSGLSEWDRHTPDQVKQLISSLSLMGIDVMMVGINPSLAKVIAGHAPYHVPTFSSAKEAIKRIITLSNIHLVKE